MRTYRFFVAVGGLVLLLACAAWTQEEQNRQVRRPGADGKVEGPLLPAELGDKLKLTAEQKDKIAAIEKEFAEKTKGADGKYRTAVEKAKEDKDRAAYKAAYEQLEAARKIRGDYEAKVTGLLNADQKKRFEDAQGTTSPPVRRPGAAPLNTVSPLLMPGVQEKLNLSADQKERLATLQKEFASNLLKVLNDEQKKQYEELKQGRQRPPQ